ncbi:MAG TPA: hypothetical protein VN442_16870 [Bryobacteraceae bacterium]|nr:hypothetical protein [Bryobacteraceae bacterium]
MTGCDARAGGAYDRFRRNAKPAPLNTPPPSSSPSQLPAVAGMRLASAGAAVASWPMDLSACPEVDGWLCVSVLGWACWVIVSDCVDGVVLG